MPKLIFTSRYLRAAPPEQLKNYVKYISTREGVEKIDESKQNLPAAQAQKKLIQQILHDLPETKELLEYEDYRFRPTIQTASEFISCALEQNLDLMATRKNYVDYLANRPRVERIGEHGLFTDAGTAVVIKQVQEEVANHQGAVWTHVVSLRREDAARLGYDSGKQWMELLRSKRAMFSRYMKIDSENLRWYAAFHNESHHPHVHIVVYSAKPREGFLTKQGIEAMRSELAHSIFRQEFANLYEGQNQTRAELKMKAEEVMKELLAQMEKRLYVNSAIEGKIVLLSKRLMNTKGKKVYGYLKADVKRLVDEIVDELAGEPGLKEVYESWEDWNSQIRSTYTNQVPPPIPLSKQKQLKSIKNMVIAEALKIGSHHFTFEDFTEGAEAAYEQEPITKTHYGQESAAEAGQPEDEPETDEAYFHAEWSDAYRSARVYLYGGEGTEQDFEKAFQLFYQEAESGNALAMYDLGRMLADGLGREKDLELSAQWYQKALSAFLESEAAAAEKQKPYLQYRIGKMYAAGLGTEQDYAEAADWFTEAVNHNHKYAQYSLAGLYYRGQGVAQDDQMAFHLYRMSADQGNPYASYELAKMYRDGVGTETDGAKAGKRFEQAFSGFLSLEKKSHDDKLQYRLGQMLFTGTGTEKNEEEAAVFWEKASKLGNVNAQYALGSYWLTNQIGDPKTSVEWIRKAAQGEHTAALYALAKLYLAGEVIEQDIPKAIQLFEKAAGKKHDFAAYRLGKLYLSGELIEKNIDAALHWLSEAAEANNIYALYTLGKLFLSGEVVEKNIPLAVRYLERAAGGGNEFAEYQLGRLYLNGEDAPKDVEAAIHWLSQASKHGNQFAQYALGKLYLCGHEVPRDREKAIPLLEAAAAQGNIYAQFLLDHIDSFRDPSVFLVATRLLRQMANVFREEEEKHRRAGGHTDRKLRRRIQQKKAALGHKQDDQEPRQNVY